MNILTAQVTSVAIGVLEIEGMLREDNVFGVAVPQIATVFPYFHDSPEKASQKLKRLMGDGFKPHKVKTKYNRNATLFVDIDQFISVIKALSKKQDPIAIAMIDDL